MRFSTMSFFTVGLVALQVAAGPIRSRQVGDLDCNLARVRIIGALASTVNTVDTFSNATDAATAMAAQHALAGLATAQDGITKIVVALFEGAAAPPEARDEVGGGMAQAQTALASIVSTDCAVTEAKSSLDAAIAAGNDVVSLCK